MLHELQKQFLNDLFNLEESPKIVSVISETDSRSAVDQFISYRDSVIAGIIEALAISYPVVKKLVGEQFFNHIAQKFIQLNRSLSPDLNNYGYQFSDFINTLKSTDSVPYLTDIAKLEWAWQKIINGDNIKPGNLHLLSNLNEQQNEKLKFELTPHTSLIQSKFPIQQIWQVNQKESLFETEIQLTDNEIYLLIWRNELDMNITPIGNEQWDFLFLIHQDILFTDICQKFNELYPQHDIGALLTQCIQSGWIYSYKII